MSDAQEEHGGKISIGDRNIPDLRCSDDIDMFVTYDNFFWTDQPFFLSFEK